MSSVSATSTTSTTASCIAAAAASYVKKVTGSGTGDGDGGGGGGGGGAVQSVDPANDSTAHEAREPHAETVKEAAGGDAKAIKKLAQEKEAAGGDAKAIKELAQENAPQQAISSSYPQSSDLGSLLDDLA